MPECRIHYETNLGKDEESRSATDRPCWRRRRALSIPPLLKRSGTIRCSISLVEISDGERGPARRFTTSAEISLKPCGGKQPAVPLDSGGSLKLDLTSSVPPPPCPTRRGPLPRCLVQPELHEYSAALAMGEKSGANYSVMTTFGDFHESRHRGRRLSADNICETGAIFPLSADSGTSLKNGQEARRRYEDSRSPLGASRR